MSSHTAEELLDTLIRTVVENMGIPQEELNLAVSLDRYGADSMQWANMAYELSVQLSTRISAEELASYGSVDGMMAALVEA